MKTVRIQLPLIAVSLLVNCFLFAVRAQTFQVVSGLPPGQPPPAGASGDSVTPVISPDGRYVLFASTANNLLLNSNNAPIAARTPPSLNVFLRDRVSRTTTLVSVNLSGLNGGNGDSLPVDITPDGRFALFESSASDLVANDTNSARDIFVRDLVAGTTVLVSVSTNGGAGNGASRSPAMTPDGRYVAFVSAANNLAAGDTNGIADIFVRDLQAGTTAPVSAGAKARPASGTYLVSSSEAPDITPDGRYVLFYSTATNVVPGVPPSSDIYVADLVGGTTTWASVGARDATQAALHTTNIYCFNHVISADGQFVAYEAAAASGTLYPGVILRYSLVTGLTDLIHTNATASSALYEDIHNLDITPDGRFIAFVANTNGTSGTTSGVYVWDAQSGALTLVSGDLSGNIASNSICDWPSMDASGRYVAFLSSAANLVANSTPGDYHLYVRDLQSGTTSLIDADTNGVGSVVSPATVPHLTSDGALVAFECPDGSMVPGDRNRDYDVFVRALQPATTELISAHDAALPTTTPNGLSTLSTTSISRNGRYIAFASEADNLVANDTNNCRDVFVRDLFATVPVLVSVDTNGFSGDGLSTDPAISADGRFVAFTSAADNVVAGDTNHVQDVFMRDLQTGTTTLISLNNGGTAQGNKASYSPTVGASGRYVLFRSLASNLAAGGFTGDNLFLRDTQTGATYALTTSGAGVAAMTPDGRFVVFASTGSGASVYVWDVQAAARIYTNATSVGAVAISQDGRLAAYATITGLYTVDVASGSRTLLDNSVLNYLDLRISQDRHWLTCTRLPPSVSVFDYQVYLYDLGAHTSRVVSLSTDGVNPGNGRSDSADISADSRFIAYRSAAGNLVAGGDTNGLPDIYLYDMQTGATTLLSAGQSGSLSPNNRSLAPVFSGDGQTLFFQSWASDLTAQDFNHYSDIFAYAFFYAVILPAQNPGEGPWLTWPWQPGSNYGVQFKNALDDAGWQPLSGTVTNSGTRAWVQDSAPNPGQRFYRIFSF